MAATPRALDVRTGLLPVIPNAQGLTPLRQRELDRGHSCHTRISSSVRGVIRLAGVVTQLRGVDYC